jgi:hypothetical protein
LLADSFTVSPTIPNERQITVFSNNKINISNHTITLSFFSFYFFLYHKDNNKNREKQIIFQKKDGNISAPIPRLYIKQRRSTIKNIKKYYETIGSRTEPFTVGGRTITVGL